EVAALADHFRRYADSNPPSPRVEYEIKDLQTVPGVNLSWWPEGVDLVEPGAETSGDVEAAADDSAPRS
uniref:hypothetical protein n=1 Tax=Escherichia coli TaxID=562 RepID=UPI003754BDAB